MLIAHVAKGTFLLRMLQYATLKDPTPKIRNPSLIVRLPLWIDLKVCNNRERTVAAEGKTKDFRISEFGLSTQGFRSQLTAFDDPGSTYIAALLRRSEYGQRGKRIKMLLDAVWKHLPP